MASVFSMKELRSKYVDWRSGRKNDAARELDETAAEPHVCTIVHDPKGAFDLSVLLENIVIPKLIAGRGKPSRRIGKQGLAETIGTERKRPISAEDVEAFTDLTLNSEASELLDFIDNCLATGSSVEAIYVNLLAPSARRLGEFWEEDSEDFVDVTMGLWRIQEVLRELTLRIPPSGKPGQGRRSALFSTMPGEQHSLGTLMVAECFQRAGWDADILMEPTRSELTGKFAGRHYDLVGLTLSNDCPSEEIAGLVSSIRSVSKNSGVCVMLGGRLINENPDLVRACGADGTAPDAVTAIELANRLVPLEATAPDLLA